LCEPGCSIQDIVV